METPTPLDPPKTFTPGQKTMWSQLYGASQGLAIAKAAEHTQRPLLVVTANSAAANKLISELQFFLKGLSKKIPVIAFPDWETLPYDHFSPHQDIIAERLATLYQLPSLEQGIVVAPINTLMYRLCPRAYVDAHTLILKTGDKIDLISMRERLSQAGYQAVPQVMTYGEFSIRGSILDLYPSGTESPLRIDFFDDELESIRSFDPDTQRSQDKIDHVRLLPAREFPMTSDAIKKFRTAWRSEFSGDPRLSPLYQSVSEGHLSPGIEYYIPLFFDHTDLFFDFLPENTIIFRVGDIETETLQFWNEAKDRYDLYKGDPEHPALPAQHLFLQPPEVLGGMKRFPQVSLEHTGVEGELRFETLPLPKLEIDARKEHPMSPVQTWLEHTPGRVLFCAETAGQREVLLDLFKTIQVEPKIFDSWQAFIDSSDRIGMTVAGLDEGLMLLNPTLTLVPEAHLLGQKVMQRRLRQRTRSPSFEASVHNLAELTPGDPVVHLDHGVGRYRGLQTLDLSGFDAEFVCVEYAGSDKLYVPVSSLHLISRYSGADLEHAPLHRLGSPHWEKEKQKAQEKIHDVAAELLELYALRASRPGFEYAISPESYQAFAAGFPFEETPDQESAIVEVLKDMSSKQPMDRLICGDVGFGKTEVAMRAAFIATEAGKQVGILVPTTLLAEQHFQSFCDRFADFAVKIEVISRFRSKKEQDRIVEELNAGKIDILIGTHKLLNQSVSFKNLGLLIIDEEHRFGVRQKEKLKAMRAEVDLLTLTATPIPRTLNMALSQIRELSIIATPPVKRLAIKTFVREHHIPTIQEAVLRELRRGGQIYYLHNDVATIEVTARKLQEYIPEARIAVAHGQMRERELERVMSDFYHQRFNVLMCTTIIETGIDIPTANTIIMDRADKLGLAQLHQLRGRVGRSHHQAYAYLFTPPKKAMTQDALKRLEAIESLEHLGAGFTLATHDLEIRGAGELLGEGQSGHVEGIGFGLYMEMLDRAIKALKEGKKPELDRPLSLGAEVDLQIPALIPDYFIHDINTRLTLYKRIASAESHDELKDLQVEMIDRFGLLPPEVKNLFLITEIKLSAKPLGIRKIEGHARGGRLEFDKNTKVDPRALIKLIQSNPSHYKMEAEKLKFQWNFEKTEDRISGARDLIQALGGQV